MKVILLDELRGKGGEGDVIEVADGFANNWLFPQKIAIRATEGTHKQLEQRRRSIQKREEVRLANANALKEQIDGKSVRIESKVGDEGQLFGSVTSVMVADAVMAQLNVEIDRKRVVLTQPIKTVGAHIVPVSLYRDIVANVVVEVNDAAGFAAIDAASAPAEEEAAEEAPATEEAAAEEDAE